MMIPVFIQDLDSVDDRLLIERLYIDNYKIMYRAISKRVSKHEDIEDIIEDTFLKATVVIGKLRKMQRHEQNAYAFGIMRNEIGMFWRKQNVRKESSNADADIEAISVDNPIDAGILERTTINEMMAAIERLHEEDQMILMMRFFEEKTYSEISKELGIKEVSVRSRVSRIVKRIGVIMNDGEN